MSKTAKIRNALVGGPLPLSQLLEKTGSLGRKSTYDLCCYLRTRGEVTIDTSSDDPVIKLTGRTPTPKRAGNKSKKPAGRRGKGKSIKHARKAGKIVTLRGIARKHIGAPVISLCDLALDNYLAAGAQLRVAIKEQVDGVDEDAVLKSALDNHDRAEKMFCAARTA